MRTSVRAFTLIELLVVIAIIAILSVVVVLTLNPSQLLMQSRDANRLSDIQTINTALGVYAAQGGTSFGSSSIVYISVPDPTATSTAGDQCQGLGLPTAPSGTTYICESSSSYRSNSGTGWIPVNFSSISIGAPIGSLPQDPLNTTSTGSYYSYTTNGTQYIVTAIPEAQKTKTNLAQNPQIPSYPEVMAQGSNLTISPLWSPSGLIGYWNFEEGSGTTALDTSGSQNKGTWSGTQAGSNGYYSAGKVGSWAGTLSSNGSTEVSLTPPASLVGSAPKSISLWFNASTLRSHEQDIAEFGTDSNYQTFGLGLNGINYIFAHLGGSGDFAGNVLPAVGTWYYVALTYNASSAVLYINGQVAATETVTAATGNTNFFFGQHLTNFSNYFVGSIDDIRVYNRALSASEIQSIYNSEK